MITVFFDGKCSLCSREIAHYKKIAPEGLFSWVDVTDASFDLNEIGVSLSDALKSLHVRSASGAVLSGVDAFLVLWRALPRWRWLAQVVAMPGVYGVARAVYRRFADYRFQRLAHCQSLGSSQ